ncbi:MAG: ComF family protein [Desulfamplus sp.]|nr:ComF family protein [Desulfamplus sp.]
MNIDNPAKYCQIDLIASSKYGGIIKESIHLLKYNGKTQLAEPLGFILFNTFVQYYSNKSTDLIVPIPLYYWKMVKRGFNQSFLLVRNFKTYWFTLKGSEPAWQIAYDILIRERDTKSQTGFNKEERKNNVKGAFAVRKNDIVKNRIKGKSIVLVDDVYTTGATAIEACNTLLEAGAASVKLIVLAQV